MRCQRCGRELKDPESIKRGYGSVCWKKMQEERKRHKTLDRILNKN